MKSENRPTDARVPQSRSQRTDGSPFQEAESLEKRLKLFVWGDSGVGKTTLALQFPQPVVIDLEGGTDLYGDSFNFAVKRVSTAGEVVEAEIHIYG